MRYFILAITILLLGCATDGNYYSNPDYSQNVAEIGRIIGEGMKPSQHQYQAKTNWACVNACTNGGEDFDFCKAKCLEVEW